MIGLNYLRFLSVVPCSVALYIVTKLLQIYPFRPNIRLLDCSCPVASKCFGLETAHEQFVFTR